MISFEIKLNGHFLTEVGIDEGGQIEIAMTKLAGDDSAILNVSAFSSDLPKSSGFQSWQSDILDIGDEVTIKILEKEESADVPVQESECDVEPESVLFCSFCGKGNREVEQMVSGKDAFICNECISMCNEIADQKNT